MACCCFECNASAGMASLSSTCWQGSRKILKELSTGPSHLFSRLTAADGPR